eukprot:gene12227-8414_t
MNTDGCTAFPFYYFSFYLLFFIIHPSGTTTLFACLLPVFFVVIPSSSSLLLLQNEYNIYIYIYQRLYDIYMRTSIKSFLCCLSFHPPPPLTDFIEKQTNNKNLYTYMHPQSPKKTARSFSPDPILNLLLPLLGDRGTADIYLSAIKSSLSLSPSLSTTPPYNACKVVKTNPSVFRCAEDRYNDRESTEDVAPQIFSLEASERFIHPPLFFFFLDHLPTDLDFVCEKGRGSHQRREVRGMPTARGELRKRNHNNKQTNKQWKSIKSEEFNAQHKIKETKKKAKPGTIEIHMEREETTKKMQVSREVEENKQTNNNNNQINPDQNMNVNAQNGEKKEERTSLKSIKDSNKKTPSSSQQQRKPLSPCSDLSNDCIPLCYEPSGTTIDLFGSLRTLWMFNIRYGGPIQFDNSNLIIASVTSAPPSFSFSFSFSSSTVIIAYLPFYWHRRRKLFC